MGKAELLYSGEEGTELKATLELFFPGDIPKVTTVVFRKTYPQVQVCRANVVSPICPPPALQQVNSRREATSH